MIVRCLRHSIVSRVAGLVKFKCPALSIFPIFGPFPLFLPSSTIILSGSPNIMTMENYASEMFLGWQRYPSNLSLSALDVDTTRCDERLSENTERLFVPQEADCQLKMLNLTSQNGSYLDSNQD